MNEMSNTLLAISLIGFGVQQFLQVVADPLVAVLITYLHERKPAPRQQPIVAPVGGVVAHEAGVAALAAPAGTGETATLPGGITPADAKKAIMGLIAFFFGLVIVRAAGDDLLLLKALELDSASRGLDEFVSALTLAAGTEGANSVIKLLQYAKDVVKARTPDKA